MSNIALSVPTNANVFVSGSTADVASMATNNTSAPATSAGAAPAASSKLLVPVATVEAAHVDGEHILSRTRDEFVKLFRACEEKTARATLEMCRSVYEASKVLNEAEFDAFCREIGYKDTSSSIRKFLAIGKVMPRMIQFAEQLPASWTNIYLLTQIPANTFEAMLEQGRSFKKLTNSDLVSLVKETRDNNSITGHLPQDKQTKQLVFAKVAFTKLPVDDIDWRAMRKAFAELESRLPIKFSINKRSEEAWQVRKDKMYQNTKVRFAKEELRPDLWDFGREATAVAKNRLPVADTAPEAATPEQQVTPDEKQAA